MSNEMALLDCAFGWGKTCRLFEESIEVAGKSYNLDELTSIHPTYRTLFGVPSARLELSFGPQHLTLRGIPEPETARRMVGYLLTHCATQTEPERHRPRSAQARDLARAQARAWERTNKMPVIPGSSRDLVLTPEADHIPPSPRPEPLSQELDLDESSLFTADEITLSVPVIEQSDTSEQPTSTLEAYTAQQEPQENIAQLAHIPRLQPPLHSVHLIVPEKKRLDSCSVPAMPAIKSNVLPVIHVPVRLQPGECAHYSIGATLCSDRLSGPEQTPYLPLDYGLLILTNRRIFYIGKRSQLVLPYTRLWYVSLLNTVVALHLEGQFRRIIIDVEHAQEWASRIDQLAFIARRAPSQPVRLPLSTNALLALKSASDLSTTLKRTAIKAPVAPQNAPYLSQIARPQKIVEARTIELDEQDRHNSTHEFLPQGLPEATEIQNSMHDDAQEEFDTFKTNALAGQLSQEESDAFRTNELAEQLSQEEFDVFRTNELAGQLSQEELDAFRTNALAEQLPQDFDDFQTASLDDPPTQQFTQMKSSALADLPTVQFDTPRFKTPRQQVNHLPDNEPGELDELEDDAFRTSELAELPTQQFSAVRVDTLAEQPALQLNQLKSGPLAELIARELAEIETIALGINVHASEEQLHDDDDDDEQTICLQERRKAHAQAMLQRLQTPRKLSDLEAPTDFKIRRMPRGRARKRF